MVVIKAFLDEDGSLAPYGLPVEYAKIHSQGFDQLLCSHVKREGNSVTHNLAKYAINIPDFLVWMEDIPPQLFLYFRLI